AKELDPNDPTPWFYDAIRKQTLNRPGEALLDMQQAITLNDNRAVFRSRLLLDEDLASRSASLGRIYNDLAFETLALRQGAKALNADPADFSAHRLLADMYASRPRHEIARVSELLQSQLLQPLNLNPVSPQLAESNLLIAEGQGPSAPSFNEFNPLFTRDRTTIQASAVIGENATYGGEATISGLKQWFSYSAGAFYYDTDGFRPNNDLNQGIYNVFTQMALTPKQSLQLEYRFKDTENGDLGLRFDMEDYSSDRRDEVEEQLGRIGYRLSINPNQDVVASVIYVSKQGTQRFSQQVGYMDPFPYILNQNSNEETNSITGEVQHIFRTKKLRSVIGAGYSDHDHSGFQDLNLSFGPIISLLPSSEFDNKIRHANAYSYLHYDMSEQLMVSLGLSFETYDQDTINEDQLNPKMGIDWKMLPGLTLRAAAFRTLTRSWASNQTLEPTQIAGFNQFFVDRSGTDTWSYCSGLDFKLSNRITLGGELTYRYLTSPIISSKRKSEEAKEQMHRAYIYYLPIRKLSLSLEYLYEDYLSMQANQESLKPRSLLTQELPLTLSYFSPFGWFIKGRGRYIRQDIEFDIATGGTAKDNEDFVIADLSLGYRFPKRIGKLSMEIHNVFDTNFRYYDMVLPSGNTFNPEIKPEREVILSMTVAF
ncbi:MAG: TonB-dependent receptor, partial [Desulfatitalea sp.]|nr:TonB-dependent receptor [Desulfatitalea sp.]